MSEGLQSWSGGERGFGVTYGRVEVVLHEDQSSGGIFIAEISQENDRVLFYAHRDPSVAVGMGVTMYLISREFDSREPYSYDTAFNAVAKFLEYEHHTQLGTFMAKGRRG